MQNFEKLGASNDVSQNKQLKCISDDLSQIKHIETQELSGLFGSGAGEKRGAPKNEGISDDLYENKRPKNSSRRISDDVYENT